MGSYEPANCFETPRFSGVRTFMRLPNVQDLQNSDGAIVGSPFDTGASFRAGARLAPRVRYRQRAGGAAAGGAVRGGAGRGGGGASLLVGEPGQKAASESCGTGQIATLISKASATAREPQEPARGETRAFSNLPEEQDEAFWTLDAARMASPSHRSSTLGAETSSGSRPMRTGREGHLVTQHSYRRHENFDPRPTTTGRGRHRSTQ